MSAPEVTPDQHYFVERIRRQLDLIYNNDDMKPMDLYAANYLELFAGKSLRQKISDQINERYDDVSLSHLDRNCADFFRKRRSGHRRCAALDREFRDYCDRALQGS